MVCVLTNHFTFHKAQPFENYYSLLCDLIILCMKKFLFLILVCCSTLSKAQSNLGCYYDSLMNQILCGSMSIQGDPDNICDDGVHLWVTFSPNAGYSPSLIQEAFGSTDSYKVVQPLFNYETQTAPISANIFTDDIWSSVIQLPFKFCFFENKYTSIVIGANGQISFDTTLAYQFNGYNTLGWPPLPFFNSSVNNAIFCPYHDILPTAGGSITYSVEGIAPCRKFIISWTNVPMYDCVNLTATQQIVLTEGSFRIDVNLINKPMCPTWLNGVAYMGIQNDVATKAFTPPGYNGGPWTANNESWSFIPIGSKNLFADTNSVSQGFYWVDSFSNDIIGFGDTLNYWPQTDTTIYVFFGDTTLLNDSCFVNGIDTCFYNACGKGYSCNGQNPYIRLHYYKPHAAFTDSITAYCANSSVQFFNFSTGCSSYYWDFGDGTFDTQPSPTHIYTGSGPFVAKLIAYGFGCADSLSAVISPTLVPIQASFTLSADSICSSTPITSNNTSTGPNLTYTWYMGDGTMYTSFDITHTYVQDGVYTVLLVIQDTVSGCIDSATQTVFVDPLAQAKFTIAPASLCVGEIVYITDSFSSNVINFYYDMGNGDTLSNTHNPTEKYLTAGDFDITLHTSYPVCPMQTTTHTVHVDDYPKVDLGLPEEICTGRGSVIITDNANPTATYLWSTGANTNSITVTAPGTYQVTVTKGECETKASKLIVPDLDCIFIPNAFTPNGDGRNDYFKPQWYDINDIGTYHMIVYNRFGEQVYSTDDKNDKGWDGTFKNKPCSMDAYMYLINVVSTDGNKKSFKGDVTLIR